MMKKTQTILKEAGYFEERRVDISHIMQMYNHYGYHYNNIQKMFIERYAYLEIHYSHPLWKQDMLIRLDPIEAQKVITMDVVEEYNEYLQDKLLIIGDIERENMTMFLSDKGSYFGGYDDCLINWGNNFEVMIDMLVSGVKGELHIID